MWYDTKMEFTEKDLDNLSALARITVSSEEKEKMLHDMQAILHYVSEINSIDIPQDDETPLVYNVVRDDVILRETGALTEALLANAPEREGDYVKVTQVLTQ